jgi:hypothetical protein
VRVSIIHNPNLVTRDSPGLTDPETGVKLSNIIYQALYKSDIDIEDLKNTFKAALESEGHVRLVDQIKAFSAGSPIVEMITEGYTKDWSKLYSKLNEAGLDQDFTGLVVNGRVRLQRPVFVSNSQSSHCDLHRLSVRSFPAQHSLPMTLSF